MLTPAQIRSHRFTSAVRGSYKAEEVDAFFEEVAASYEQAFRENAELIKKISVLAQKVEEYRADEDNIKATLLTAQRVADEMMSDAGEKSAQMLKAASERQEYVESSSKAKAQIVIDEANKTARDKIFEAEIKADETLADAAKKSEKFAIFSFFVSGGMQDFNYVVAGVMEITLEVSCCKFPPRSMLRHFWEENK